MPPKHRIQITKRGRPDADIFLFNCESCGAPVKLSRRQQKRRQEKNRWRCSKCYMRDGMVDRTEKGARVFEEMQGAPPKLYPCRMCGRLTVNRFYCSACLDERCSSRGEQGELIYGGVVHHGRVMRGSTNAA